MFSFRFARWLCVLPVIAAIPAFCTVISQTYSDRTTWQSATGGVTTVTFEGIAPYDSSTAYNNSTGLVISGTRFTGIQDLLGNFYLSVVNPGPNTFWYNFNGTSALAGPWTQNATFTPSIHIVLPAPATSFGVDLGTLNPNGSSFTIALDTTAMPNIVTAAQRKFTFYGVTSTTPFTVVDLSLPGAPVNASALIDNVSYGTALSVSQDPGQTPELGTFLLIGSGLVGMALMRRRLFKNCGRRFGFRLPSLAASSAP